MFVSFPEDVNTSAVFNPPKKYMLIVNGNNPISDTLALMISTFSLLLIKTENYNTIHKKLIISNGYIKKSPLREGGSSFDFIIDYFL